MEAPVAWNERRRTNAITTSKPGTRARRGRIPGVALTAARIQPTQNPPQTRATTSSRLMPASLGWGRAERQAAVGDGSRLDDGSGRLAVESEAVDHLLEMIHVADVDGQDEAVLTSDPPAINDLGGPPSQL